MKKFMKAIAFVTVMCMALSTVAFANSVPENADADKTFVVTVTKAGSSDQVALMVVDAAKNDYDFSDPLYIDQKGATNGAVEFTAKIARDVDEVAVYVGYAANGENPAIKVGTVKLNAPITEVAITKTESGAVIGSDGRLGMYATVNFTAIPDGYSLNAMIWALELKEGGYKYTKAIEGLEDYGYGVLSGDTKFSAIMDIPENLEFSGKADAIFLFVKSGAENKEAYSDNSEIHSGKKVTNNSGGN